VNTFEDRLRDAYRAAADTVRPEALPGLPDRVTGRTHAPKTARLRRRTVGIPLAAAAAVAVIAVTTSVVLPGLLTRKAEVPVRAPAGSVAHGFPGDRLPTGSPPRYFVAVVGLNSGATALDVFNSATGHIVGRLAPPAPGRDFQAVAVLGNDRTFVAEAAPENETRCGAWLYEFRITAQGTPTGLTPLVVPYLAGRPALPALAASADGDVVAYDMMKCKETRAGVIKDYGSVGVIHLGSGSTRSWTYTFPATPVSLSLSADGSLLAMVSNPSDGKRSGSDQNNSAWVLRTDSPPGPLARHYRQIIAPLGWPMVGPVAAALSPTSSVTYALNQRWHHTGWSGTLDAYETATGSLIKVICRFPAIRIAGEEVISPDISGQYLLLFGNGPTPRVQIIDLSTGRVSTVPRVSSVHWGDAAW
jgi:hypothetical protein